MRWVLRVVPSVLLVAIAIQPDRISVFYVMLEALQMGRMALSLALPAPWDTTQPALVLEIAPPARLATSLIITEVKIAPLALREPTQTPTLR